MTPWKLREAVRHLLAGNVIAYPTEAVYGLGCNPFNPAAVARLLQIKNRPMKKGLILVAADYSQIEYMLEKVTPSQHRRAMQAWPGPVTWIWPATPATPVWLRGAHAGIAVRISAHPLVRQLCNAFGGPIVSTSANLAHNPPARNALEVHCRLGSQLDLILHGEASDRQSPSEIRDLLSGKTIRAG